MEIKANIHLHSSDDPQDFIPYDFRAGIDAAAQAGFGAIALTCHNKFVDNPEYEIYAREKNILLIRGIEKNILGKHVVILNADVNAEKLETFEALARYKKERPEAFILAPHPYFGLPYCLGKYLDKNISIFDAIESSWFYSKKINFNRKAEEIARKNNLPFIATSDTHRLKTLDRSFAIINAESKTPEAIFEAIRRGKFRNVSVPARFWKDMVFGFISGEFSNLFGKFSAERFYHALFGIGIFIKGIISIFEIIFGFVLLFFSYETIGGVASFFIQGELAENPIDFIWGKVISDFQTFPATPKSFWIFLFFSHGIIKLFLIWGLLRKKLWSYILSAGIFTLFVISQIYELTRNQSILLWAITIFDVLLIILILHEYKHAKKRVSSN